MRTETKMNSRTDDIVAIAEGLDDHLVAVRLEALDGDLQTVLQRAESAGATH